MTRLGGPLLEVEDLHAGYGDLAVLFGVSLIVREGEVVALMGSNGAGKTTTLRSITGLLRPSAGRVRLAGRDVTGAAPEALVRQGLVMVPEGRGILADMTVMENLQLGAYAARDPKRVPSILDEVFGRFPILAERRRQPAGTLSGGEQQMLALGRALMSSPRLMLLDEASLGLSPAMTETAFSLIRELNANAGVAVLVVEQNVRALDLAQSAYALERGRVVAHASGSDVRVLQARLREAYLGAAVPSPPQEVPT